MAFTAAEKKKMLELKGVGETVVARLEQIGFSSLSQLAGEDPAFVTKQISQMMGPDGQVKFPHPWPPQIPPGRTAGL